MIFGLVKRLVVNTDMLQKYMEKWKVENQDFCSREKTSTKH